MGPSYQFVYHDEKSYCVEKYYQGEKLIKHLRENKTPAAVRFKRPFQSGEEAAAMGRALAENTSLKFLTLEGSSSRIEGAEAIGMALASNSTLIGLSIRRDSMGGAEGMGMVLDGISQSKSLEQFSMDDFVDSPIAIALGKALEKSTSMLKLSLDASLYGPRNRFGDEGALSIAEGIAKSTSLKDVSLKNCDIGKEGAIALGKALEKSTSLLKLSLDDNKFGDEGAVGIAEGIAKSTSLKDVSLKDCDIGKEGSIALGKALEKSTSLDALNLNGNSMGNEGARGIAEGIAKNTSLRKIDVGWCKIGDDGLLDLGRAVGKSQSLRELSMYASTKGRGDWGRTVMDEAIVGLVESIPKMKSLTSLHIGGGISHRGNLNILLAIRQSPNLENFQFNDPHQYMDENPVKNHVGKLFKELKLPQATGFPYASFHDQQWQVDGLFQYWAAQIRILAFAMVSHKRLGVKEGGEAASCFHRLDENLIRMIGSFVLDEFDTLRYNAVSEDDNSDENENSDEDGYDSEDF